MKNRSVFFFCNTLFSLVSVSLIQEPWLPWDPAKLSVCAGSGGQVSASRETIGWLL